MVWQWLNFSWTESIKKRACRAFLNRYLGKYLDQRLELEGMTLELANGCCSVENVRLSAQVSRLASGDSASVPHSQNPCLVLAGAERCLGRGVRSRPRTARGDWGGVCQHTLDVPPEGKLYG